MKHKHHLHRPGGEDRALQAARSAGILPAGPVRAEVLKNTGKSLVVRLEPQGQRRFVAKKSRPKGAAIEALVYTEILPQLTLRHLELLGLWTDDELGSWLFLEDAGDDPGVKPGPAERWAVGRLLGRIAAETAGSPLLDHLPARGVAYYRTILEQARQRLTPARTSYPVVAQALGQLVRVEQLWDRLIAMAADCPTVLCHSDVNIRKNLRFVAGREGFEPVLLDWDLAARGPAAVDLGCQVIDGEGDPLLDGYLSGSGTIASSAAELLLWGRVGRIYRLLHGMNWASLYLATRSPDRGLRRLNSYVAYMDRVLGELEPSLFAGNHG